MQSTIQQAAGLGGTIRAVRQERKKWRQNETAGRASRAAGKEASHA